jgi:hypothetical protein
MDIDEEIVLKLPRYGFGKLSIKWFIEEYMYQRSKTSEPTACIADIHSACKMFYGRMSKKAPLYISVWRICREMRDIGTLLDIETPESQDFKGSKINKQYVALSPQRISEIEVEDEKHAGDAD